MNLPDPSDTFLVEADELLEQVEQTLLEIENNPEAVEAVHQLFRAFHTIKGSGAMFGFTDLSSFAHHVETVLDKVRDRALRLSPELVGLILESRDHIKALLEANRKPNPALNTRSDILQKRLQAFLPNAQVSAPAAAAVTAVSSAAHHDGPDSTYHIRFKPAPAIATSGMDPSTLLNDLRALGEAVIQPDFSAVPLLPELKPEHCQVAWDISLTTAHEQNAVRDVFLFVEDESTLSIEKLPAQHAASEKTEAAAEETEGVPTERVGTNTKSQKPSVVRVPSEKLDRLVNLVGEMVINQSRLLQISARLNDPDLAGPVESLERLVAEMRDSVLGIRMTPIGSTFGRFKRLVHDLSRDLGKEIDLVTEGAETELDKTVLDQLGDPLVHLIRNSVDHGISRPDERLAAGKPARGTIRLTASHQGSHVVITIEDDGKGIDAQAVRQKAIEKKLIDPSAVLSEREILELIFAPGLSTAKAVTSVSGRGVGMDVVKRQLDALRGGITVVSRPGQGTRFELTLPLTLAIIEGLLVEVAGDPFILPLSSVMENVEVDTEKNNRTCGQTTVAVRGELISYLQLRELFAIPGEAPRHEKIVILSTNGQRVGIAVDRVLGKHQTVLQSLGRFYRNVEVVSGATIMGDGRVALILDVGGLLRFHGRLNLNGSN